jgi:hypothetical protein
MPIRACWLSWIAVKTSDQAGVVAQTRLASAREVSWADGAELVDEVAHSGDQRFSTVVVTPAIEGWTLVIGPWCGLLHLENVAPVTDLCQQLSARFGQAQAYFHSEQNDGEAWLVAVDGRIVRRWIGEYPELALGEPFGVERRLLDAYGITGKPEDLAPEDDKLGEWTAGWGDCYATTIAAEFSLDPTEISQDTNVSGAMLVANTPSF